MEKYLALVEKRRKRNRLSGRIGVGVEYETNRNASPQSGERLFSDSPLALADSSKRKQDSNRILLGGLEWRRDLGSQAGHEAFAGATFYQAEQERIKTLNLQAVSLQGGGVWKAGKLSVTPTLLFDHVRLSQATYLRNRGGGLRVDRRINRPTSVFIEFRDMYQDYARTREVPAAPERNGVQWDLSAGFDRILTPTRKLNAALTHTVKRASKSYNAYLRDAVSLRHSWLLGKGTFLVSSLALGYDRYTDPDTFVSGRYRRDTTLRAGMLYGSPLTPLSPKLKDLLGTLNLDYYRVASTVRNYAYTDFKFGAMLTYRWELSF